MDIKVKNIISTYEFKGLAETAVNRSYLSRDGKHYLNTSSEAEMFDFGESCKYVSGKLFNMKRYNYSVLFQPKQFIQYFVITSLITYIKIFCLCFLIYSNRQTD